MNLKTWYCFIGCCFFIYSCFASTQNLNPKNHSPLNPKLLFRFSHDNHQASQNHDPSTTVFIPNHRTSRSDGESQDIQHVSTTLPKISARSYRPRPDGESDDREDGLFFSHP